MELILIRHTAVDVPPGICYGQTDVALKSSFLQEALQVQTNLQSLIGEESVPVYSSPLSRCRRLAEFCGYHTPTFDSRLMEMNFGDWELHRFNDITDEQIRKWFNNWIDETPTNGESFKSMIARVGNFIEELQHLEYQRAVLFTHGGVIACARVYAGLTSPESAFDNPAVYGEIVQLSF